MLSMDIEKIKKEDSVRLQKIELNDVGDCIVLSADDPQLFDRFAAGFNRIMDMAEDVPGKLADIEKQYAAKKDFKSVIEKTVAMAKVNVKFSEDSVEAIDGIFGEGTVRKYFADVYREIPDFMPDADSIIDFMESIVPTLEKMFSRKVETRTAASKARMAKYQPQDHKKSASRTTKADKK